MDEPHLSQWKQHGYDKLLGMNHQVLTPPGNMAFSLSKTDYSHIRILLMFRKMISEPWDLGVSFSCSTKRNDQSRSFSEKKTSPGGQNMSKLGKRSVTWSTFTVQGPRIECHTLYSDVLSDNFM